MLSFFLSLLFTFIFSLPRTHYLVGAETYGLYAGTRLLAWGGNAYGLAGRIPMGGGTFPSPADFQTSFGFGPTPHEFLSMRLADLTSFHSTRVGLFGVGWAERCSLGSESQTDTGVPTMISSAEGIAYVTGGEYSGGFIRDAPYWDAWGWGDNGNGVFGTGDYEDLCPPKMIDSNVNQIAFGRWSSIVIDSDRWTIRYSGDAAHGDLGLDWPMTPTALSYSEVNISGLTQIGLSPETHEIILAEGGYNLYLYVYRDKVSNLETLVGGGLACVVSLSTDDCGTDVIYPFEIPFWEKGDVKSFPRNSQLLQVTCVFYDEFCAAIVVAPNTTGWVVTWGTTHNDAILGRIEDAEHPLYEPFRIADSDDILLDEQPIQVGLSLYGGLLLMDTGRLLIWGVDSPFSFLTGHADSVSPFLLLDPELSNVSYVPPRLSFYFQILLGDVKCFGYLPLDIVRACSGRGRCNGTDTCICVDGYAGEDCGRYAFCHGYSSFDTQNVCSNHGECVSDSNCVCDVVPNPYSGVDCSIPPCNGIIGANEVSVCSGAGSCVDLDACVCQIGYYGVWCQEFIAQRASFDSKHRKVIRLVYVAPMELIEESLSVGGSASASDCSMIVVNLPEGTSCWFEKEQFMSSHSSELIMSSESRFRISELQVRPFTVDPTGGRDVLLRIPIDLAVGVQAFPAAAVVVPILLLVFLLAIGIALAVVVVIRWRVIRSQRTQLELFSELENFDVLLEEQKVRGSAPRLRLQSDFFEIPSGDVQLVSILGSGGSGATVYCATWEGRDVAYKVFPSSLVSVSAADFEREFTMATSLRHPNILAVYGCSLKHPRIGIVMELCRGGSISSHIQLVCDGGDAVVWTLLSKIEVLIGICQGMNYLHQRDVIHRDLKGENVLLTEVMEPKIIDFGLSRIVHQGGTVRLTQRVGTSWYMAPEVTKGRMYGPKCDVFSFGILMFEVLMETIDPYNYCSVVDQQEEQEQQRSQLLNRNAIEFLVAEDPEFRPRIDVVYQNEEETVKRGRKSGEDIQKKKTSSSEEWYIELMSNCWAHETEKRPSFAEILADLTKVLESGVLGKELVTLPVLKYRALVDNISRMEAEIADLESRENESLLQ